jgi:hypothetical protein
MAFLEVAPSTGQITDDINQTDDVLSTVFQAKLDRFFRQG